MTNNRSSFFANRASKTAEIIKNELSPQDLEALNGVVKGDKLLNTIAEALSLSINKCTA